MCAWNATVSMHVFVLGAGLFSWVCLFNTLRPRQHGRHFADNTFKCIFLNENVIISIKISLKFVPKGPINNIPALVQIMAWRWPDDKPLSEAMMVSLLMHICVTWPQWVNCCPLIDVAVILNWWFSNTYQRYLEGYLWNRPQANATRC